MGQTDAARAARRRERRAWAIEAHVLRHGQHQCECGCGRNASFDQDGRPHRFKLGHAHPSFDAANAARLAGNIPIEDFRAAVKKMREQKGWTIEELAAHAGVSHSSVSGILYARRRKTVSREWATFFLRRCAGLAVVLPPAQQKRMSESIKSEQRRHNAWIAEV